MRRLIAAAGASALLLGCSADGPSGTAYGDRDGVNQAVRDSRSYVEALEPDRWPGVEASSAGEYLIADGDLYLLLHGSSSCPPEPEVLEFDRRGYEIVSVTLGPVRHLDDRGDPVLCTEDYARHLWRIGFEDEVVEDAEIRFPGFDPSPRRAY